MTNITEPQNKDINNPILFDTCKILYWKEIQNEVY